MKEDLLRSACGRGGNVWEWCFDWQPSYIGSQRVEKGGGYNLSALYLQVGTAGDMGYPYDGISDIMGFRLARNK
jgi:formylglycine-generating enzyme required for sulfatase activity